MARIAGMPGPAAGSAVPAGRARTLAQVYRHFGAAGAAGTSPLYERVAVAVSESGEALRGIEAAPARERHPTVILAALHDLALAGRAPALAAAYAAADGEAAAGAAIGTLLRMTGSVVAIAVRRQTRASETGRCAVLYPAIAEAARRVGANAVGLIDVGCSAGLNLNVDRVGITCSNGQSLGDPSSAVQLSSSIAGDRPVPARAMPGVVARVGVDLDPVDVTDAGDARWLRACLWPDQPDRAARLEAEMALAATAPPLLLQGDAVEVVPGAFARVPADALPVVTTTWTLSRFPPGSRLRFPHRLGEAAAGRAVAWVSAEGVGVAPAIPAHGDRRASGHSIIGLAVSGRPALRAEAIGRCWSQGRLLAWLADSWCPVRLLRRRTFLESGFHGVSRQTVSEIWRAFGLKPWRQDEFQISPDPDLIEKIRDLAGLYLSPPVAAAVYVVDEKPQIQALDRSAPILPMLPATPQKATHDYVRNGTLGLFAALEVATGKVITGLRKSHTAADFIAFLNKIDREVTDDLDVHVIPATSPPTRPRPCASGYCATPGAVFPGRLRR
jgi:hypothetical protein